MCHPRTTSRSRFVAITAAATVGAAAISCATTAVAQTSLPGIIISTPQPDAAPILPPFGRPVPQAIPTPQAVAPAPAPPAPKAVAKPKARVPAVAPADGAVTGGGGAQSIIMLVNDEPITALDVEHRSRLNALSANIGERVQANMKALVTAESTQTRFRAIVDQIVKENQGSKTREQILALIDQRKSLFAKQLQQEAITSARASLLPGIKKGTLEELIDERVKLQEAKRLGVNIEESQIDDILKGLAERNNMTPNQFADQLKSVGADVAAMKARFKATLSWNEVIRRRFSHQVSISPKEIDKIAASVAVAEDDIELQLQRITLPVTGKLDQKALTERFRDADRVRQSFTGCKAGAATAAKLPGAKFEDLGVRKPSTLVEPLRSQLLGAKDDEMVPPSIGQGTIELYALCSRRVVKADDKRRTDVEADLKQKEFEIFARGHLRNLKQYAQLECRAPECKK